MIVAADSSSSTHTDTTNVKQKHLRGFMICHDVGTLGQDQVAMMGKMTFCHIMLKAGLVLVDYYRSAKVLMWNARQR